MITLEYLEKIGFEIPEHYPDASSRIIKTDRGTAEFETTTNTLRLWSGLGDSESYAFEVEIKDDKQLSQVLQTIGISNQSKE